MKMEKIYTCIYERFSLLKRESFPTLSKFLWDVSFISHGHPSFLKASFEIELSPLNFNIVSVLRVIQYAKPSKENLQLYTQNSIQECL